MKPMQAFKTVVFENGGSLDTLGKPCGSNVMLFMHSNNNSKAGDWVLTLRTETYRRAVKDGAEEAHRETAQLFQHLDEELARQRRIVRHKLESEGLRGRPDAIYRFLEIKGEAAWMETSLSFGVEKAIQETERRLAAVWGVGIFVDVAEPDFITAFEGTAYRPHGSGEALTQKANSRTEK